MNRSFFTVLVIFPLCGHLCRAEIPASDELAKAFVSHDAQGTFVVLDRGKNRLIEHNQERARQRFVPASTFKIVNALIGLSGGAVESVDVILPYGGQPQPFLSWEKDMSLREAMPISNVPIYQELARRIGLEEMTRAVEAFSYGNAEVGEVVDRFWLDGPLKVSAVEQVDFLRRMLAGELGLPRDVLNAVEEITLLESSPDYKLHGKTGWGSTENIGWFVGWVAKDGVDYPFALNMDIANQEQLPVRIALAKQCLRRLGILPVAQ